MRAMTQNVSPLVLTKLIPCQRVHKMYRRMSWPIPTHASEITKSISTCFGQTHNMPVRAQNISQHVLTKRKPCQRGQTMHIKMRWPNLSHASQDKKKHASLHVYTKLIPTSEDTKCISTCVDHTHVMHLNLSWPNISHVSEETRMYWTNASNACEDTKCISACVDQTQPMPARTQNALEHALTKLLPC